MEDDDDQGEGLLQEGVTVWEKDNSLVRYTLVSLMGVGKFGEVWKALEVCTGRQVAIKFEPMDLGRAIARRTGADRPVDIPLDLRNERIALGLSKGPGVPQVFYFSELRPELLVQSPTEAIPSPLQQQMLVQTLLDYPLELLTRRLKTAAQRSVVAAEAGMQLLRTLARIHTNAGLLHCDVSMSNIMVGRSRQRQLDSFFLVDFGIASACARDGKPLPQAPDRHDGLFNGTSSFTPARVMCGGDPARCDDVESLLVCLVCLCRGGKLPWTECSDDQQKVINIKRGTSLKELCRHCPAQYIEMLQYVRSLSFKSVPDYEKLRSMLRSTLPDWYESKHLPGLLSDPTKIPPQLVRPSRSSEQSDRSVRQTLSAEGAAEEGRDSKEDAREGTSQVVVRPATPPPPQNANEDIERGVQEKAGAGDASMSAEEERGAQEETGDAAPLSTAPAEQEGAEESSARATSWFDREREEEQGLSTTSGEGSEAELYSAESDELSEFDECG